MTGSVTVFVLSGDPKADVHFGELVAALKLGFAVYDSPVSLLEEFDPELAACVVLDLRWPWRRDRGNGSSHGLSLYQVDSAVVFVSGPRDGSLCSEAVRSGLVGQNVGPLEAWPDPPTLVAAIEWSSKQHLRHCAERCALDAAARRLRSLTRREREVMALVVDGMCNREVADCLGISARTIEIHRARVMEKTGAESLSELVRMVCFQSAQIGQREPPPCRRVVRVTSHARYADRAERGNGAG